MGWKTDTCDCCCNDGCGLWALAFACPCVVYAWNLSAMKRLRIPSTVPTPDDRALLPGCVHGVAFCAALFSSQQLSLLVPALMQCLTRGDIRAEHRIDGSACEDCVCSCLFGSCSLVQEHAQLQVTDEGETESLFPRMESAMFTQ